VQMKDTHQFYYRVESESERPPCSGWKALAVASERIRDDYTKNESSWRRCLLLPGSLLVGPWEGRHWLALGARDLTGVSALERVGDLVQECVA